MDDDKEEEKRWFVSEEAISNFIKKNKNIVNAKTTNWSMTIYTLIFICALCSMAGIGLLGLIILFIPLFLIFAPFIWIEKYLRRNE